MLRRGLNAVARRGLATSAKTWKVAVVPGDGIGPEVRRTRQRSTRALEAHTPSFFLFRFFVRPGDGGGNEGARQDVAAVPGVPIRV